MSLFVDHSEKHLPEKDYDIDKRSIHSRNHDMLFSEKKYFDASEHVDTPILSDLIYNKHLPCDQADKYNATPLHYACIKNNNFWVSALLFMNANPNNQISTNGFSCLHEAAARGYIGILQKLLDFDAELDVVDDGLYTPLLRAIEKGHAFACKILLDAGSSIHSMLRDDILYSIKDKNDQNYLDVKMLLLRYIQNVDEIQYKRISSLWKMEYNSISSLNVDKVKYVKGIWRNQEMANIDNLNQVQHKFSEEVKAFQERNPDIDNILTRPGFDHRGLDKNGSSVYLRALQAKKDFDMAISKYVKIIYDFYFHRGIKWDSKTGILSDLQDHHPQDLVWDIGVDALFDDDLPKPRGLQKNQARLSGNSLGRGGSAERGINNPATDIDTWFDASNESNYMLTSEDFEQNSGSNKDSSSRSMQQEPIAQQTTIRQSVALQHHQQQQAAEAIHRQQQAAILHQQQQQAAEAIHRQQQAAILHQQQQQAAILHRQQQAEAMHRQQTAVSQHTSIDKQAQHGELTAQQVHEQQQQHEARLRLNAQLHQRYQQNQQTAIMQDQTTREQYMQQQAYERNQQLIAEYQRNRLVVAEYQQNQNAIAEYQRAMANPQLHQQMAQQRPFTLQQVNQGSISALNSRSVGRSPNSDIGSSEGQSPSRALSRPTNQSPSQALSRSPQPGINDQPKRKIRVNELDALMERIRRDSSQTDKHIQQMDQKRRAVQGENDGSSKEEK